MYKIEDITRTYGQAMDILDACDSEEIPIYIQLQTLKGGLANIPIDNYEYLIKLSSYPPDDIYPFSIVEEDGDIFLVEPDFE